MKYFLMVRHIFLSSIVRRCFNYAKGGRGMEEETTGKIFKKTTINRGATRAMSRYRVGIAGSQPRPRGHNYPQGEKESRDAIVFNFGMKRKKRERPLSLNGECRHRTEFGGNNKKKPDYILKILHL
eukprot:GEMP01083727.1.p1 GENE.GEMP01083727.1~~GEMP01083727.1.p1  ORF type:complete len:126 (-),score=1.17 GEMP01083727.1:350-727(-)